MYKVKTSWSYEWLYQWTVSIHSEALNCDCLCWINTNVKVSLLPEENTCPGLLLQQVIKCIFNLSRTLTFSPAHLSPAAVFLHRWRQYGGLLHSVQSGHPQQQQLVSGRQRGSLWTERTLRERFNGGDTKCWWEAAFIWHLQLLLICLCLN